jgi:alpha-L-rhamnosidase
LRGDDDERWAPPFTWHAGRYVQVTAADAGTAAALDAAASVCFPLRSDVDIVGSFASSSALLNAVHAADVNTYECNTMSVQSDCPARERLGYGGDVLMSHEAVSLNLDTALLYEKRVDDFIAAQRPNGGFTETAPFVGLSDAGLGGGSGPIGWQTVVPVLAAFLLARDGNAPLAARALPAVARYADLLGDPASARAIENGLGDWMTLEPAAVALTGRGFELLSFAGAADLADASGNASAAAAYRAAAAAAASYINAQFLDVATGVYAKAGQFNNTQCGQAMPLYLGIVPPAVAPAALAALESNLDAHGGHLQVGGFGVKWLLMALSDAGRADLAWRIMNQTTFPSHGYMLDAKVNNLTSATTIWER